MIKNYDKKLKKIIKYFATLVLKNIKIKLFIAFDQKYFKIS